MDLLLLMLRYGGALILMLAMVALGVGLAMRLHAPSRRVRRDAHDLMVWAGVFGAFGALLMLSSFPDVYA